MRKSSVPPRLYDVNSREYCQAYEFTNVHATKNGLGVNALVFMMESETSKKDSFLQFSKIYNPGCILDLRMAPRLDVFYGSRKLSFISFEELNIEYFDFFGRIGVNSQEQLSRMEFYFVEACVYLLSSKRYHSRPVVLFFDDDEVMQECYGYLNNSFNLHLLPVSVLSVAEFKSGLLNVKTLVDQAHK
ncbi:hypothetical protein [Pseudomonas sp. zfem005]|uniref:hypothetical protein n=1 Tax=Pseudomonas sp. zfem005 TaxID=3078200 RepID=UPI002929D694|nr:hypothetical protein [Pseudomonas sp. zfem005]MDU9413202.1 hypothetical protein [Pseudomonas sp. zfem005]